MTGQQLSLVKDLLRINDAVHKAESLEAIGPLIDEAVRLSDPVEPDMMNVDIFGKATILAGKYEIIKLLESNKEFFNTGKLLSEIKFHVSCSLAMLMVTFAGAADLRLINKA